MRKQKRCNFNELNFIRGNSLGKHLKLSDTIAEQNPNKINITPKIIRINEKFRDNELYSELKRIKNTIKQSNHRSIGKERALVHKLANIYDFIQNSSQRTCGIRISLPEIGKLYNFLSNSQRINDYNQ